MDQGWGKKSVPQGNITKGVTFNKMTDKQQAKDDGREQQQLHPAKLEGTQPKMKVPVASTQKSKQHKKDSSSVVYLMLFNEMVSTHNCQVGNPGLIPINNAYYFRLWSG